MSRRLSSQTQDAIAARVRYYRELGIYDLYRRPVDESAVAVPAVDPLAQNPEPVILGYFDPMDSDATAEEPLARLPEPDKNGKSSNNKKKSDPILALQQIRHEIGDCTRCKLHAQGRKQIVFGVGNPEAELMFVGEAPGADEDQQGEPFVGRAGQLLNKMIEAMGLKREQVYIANVVKCRPPGNRTPERDEIETCSPFLMSQIDTIKPKAVVALGAVSAKCLLAISAPMSELRGQTYDFRGSKLFVTYHPAFLLRDPRQKAEAWKDLQRVMKYLGLQAAKSGSS
jgi:DNA polymerase